MTLKSAIVITFPLFPRADVIDLILSSLSILSKISTVENHHWKFFPSQPSKMMTVLKLSDKMSIHVMFYYCWNQWNRDFDESCLEIKLIMMIKVRGVILTDKTIHDTSTKSLATWWMRDCKTVKPCYADIDIVWNRLNTKKNNIYQDQSSNVHCNCFLVNNKDYLSIYVWV